MSNFFKQWHYPANNHRTKARQVSDVFPVVVSEGFGGRIELTVTDAKGKVIRFYFDREAAQLIYTQFQERLNPSR